jgi:hypothetical protein
MWHRLIFKEGFLKAIQLSRIVRQNIERNLPSNHMILTPKPGKHGLEK